MERVTALVLTFNRKKLVKKTLDALAGQTRRLEKIFVVNNGSTDGTEIFLNELKTKYPAGLLEILTFKENLGSSGGFARGMEHVLKKTKFKWLWIMDDDAVPEKRAVEKFMHFYNSLPLKKRNRIGVLQNQREVDHARFKTNIVPVSDVFGKPIYRVTFEGYCIKREVIEKIGFPRQEFFIYSDDIEYTWRAIRNGFRAYRVCGSMIYHRDWATIEKINRGIIAKPNIPPWKLYYRFRNPFLVCQNHPLLRFFIRIILSIDLLLWSFINPENTYFAKRGITDGINLVSGKIIAPESLPIQQKE